MAHRPAPNIVRLGKGMPADEHIDQIGRGAGIVVRKLVSLPMFHDGIVPAGQIAQNGAERAVGLPILRLGDEDRAKLDAALATDRARITATAISTWFKRRDLEVNPNAIVSHRKGTCSCGR